MSETAKNTRHCNDLLVFCQKQTRRIPLYLITIIVMLSPVETQARRAESNVYKNKYAAYIIEASTGRALYRKNENKTLHPASLTKLMTLLMVFDALENNQLKLYSRVRISRYAANMSPSKLGLPVGATIKVEDAILALVTKSANDVAAALAEKLGGTEKEFAKKMTRKARSLGMKRTRFRNASGLHHSKQVSSARDMALLAHVLITDYKKYYHYFSTKSFTYKGKTYKNHNKLLYSYEGMDGMKTGYIRPSGFNLIASAMRGDHRLIGVVFGGRSGKLRNAQMKKLLDNAFKKVNGVYILASEVPVPKKKPYRNTHSSDRKDYASVQKPAATHEKSMSPVISVSAAVLAAAGEPVAYAQNNHSADTALLPTVQQVIKPEKISRWDMLDSSQEGSMFNRMIGEGDYDITVRKRIETGLIAISAQLNQALKEKHAQQSYTNTAALNPQGKTMIDKTSALNKASALNIAIMSGIEPSAAPAYHETSQSAHGDWSIQIGAFTTRDRAEKALTLVLNVLPMALYSAKTRIAPLKTAQGWIYRGRLDGYSKDGARNACAALPDCIALAPLDN